MSEETETTDTSSLVSMPNHQRRGATMATVEDLIREAEDEAVRQERGRCTPCKYGWHTCWLEKRRACCCSTCGRSKRR